MPTVNVGASFSGSVRLGDTEYLGPMVLDGLPLMSDEEDSGVRCEDRISVMGGICYPLNVWGLLRAGSAVNIFQG